MRMRFAIMAVLVAAGGIAGCSRVEQPQAEPGAQRIGCALAGAENFSQDCLFERTKSDGEELVVVRHPDGGFRRFAIDPQGAGLTAADGADTANQTLADGVLEVTVANDRYRFPTKPVAGDAAAE